MSFKTTVIPKGAYCYTILEVNRKTGSIKVENCPYWSIDPDKPEQKSGYCAYLGRGDWESNTTMSLLWDKVKECGINDDGYGDYQLEE